MEFTLQLRLINNGVVNNFYRRFTMYHYIQIDSNKIHVFLHENCEFDIHFICRSLMYLDQDATGSEYSVQPDGSAIIAFFYD